MERFRMTKEPVAISNGISGLLQIGASIAAVIGLDLAPIAEGGIVAGIIAIGQIVQTHVARSRVFTSATIDEIIGNVAREMGAGS